MSEYMCDCGNELEYFDNEWAKYNFSDDEEIVSIYKCEKCGNKYTKREGNFGLEIREEW